MPFEFIELMKIWELVPRPGKDAGKLVLKGRWVDINKADDENPNYRSRYVAKEIKIDKDISELDTRREGGRW